MSAARNSDSRLPVSVFILYDEEEKASLWAGLPTELTRLLRNDDTFTLVSSHDLKPGDEKVEKRREALEYAKIVLLLVTDAFLDSPELLKETATAISSRRLGRNIVLPVILTELDWSDQPFAAFVPIKPEWNALSSVYEAQQIYDALVDLVKTRIITADESPETTPETTKKTIPVQFPRSKLDFPSLWFFFFSLLFVVMLAGLVWFSFHPPAQSTQPAASSPQFSFFFGSMVIGIAAMSVIQVARRLFRIRGAFHQSRVFEWLGDSATQQLYQEVGEGRIKDLLDLPSELLTGQLGAIAEKVIEHQAKNESSSPLIEKMAGIPESWETASSKDTVDREVNLMLAIQRNLDQFQISASAYWRRYLLLSSVLLSMGIFVIGLFLLQTGSFISGLSDPNELDHLNLSKLTGNFGLLFLATLLSGLCAGFLGSIARDLVAIIEKLRR